MFCPKCGVKLPENSKFCNACGFDLSEPLAHGNSSIEDAPSEGNSVAEETAAAVASPDSEALTGEKASELFSGWSGAGNQAVAETYVPERRRADMPAGAGNQANSKPESASGDEAKSKHRPIVIGLLGLSLFLMFLPWVESKYIFGNSSYSMFDLMNQVKSLSEYGGSSTNSLVGATTFLFLVWLICLVLGGFALFAQLRKMDSFLGFFRFSLLSPALAGIICAFGIMAADQSLQSAIGSAGSSYGSTGRAVANAVGGGVGLGVGMALYLCIAASIAAFVLSRKVKEEEGE